ncbi:hypothetical protein A9Q84_09255 [Halobacteriovorax marinus]|uniref:Uncharacterized protein n=1 Tax=Halobacteriovorax marinus TaxID=97084 RepID=A0A1Y5F6J8_9BACT|nr:hypothetical protein A9Q84_09255 [Halobacteriovorax marinus]
MKFCYSLIIFFQASTFATPLILITYKAAEREMASQTEKIMKEQFYLTREIYHLQEVKENPCKKSNALATQLCLENGEVRVVYRNEKLMSEMLGVFWK